MRFRFKPSRLFALLLLCVVGLGPAIVAIGMAPGVELPRIFLQAPLYTVTYSGIAPTSISLNWTESTGLSFSEYVLQSSIDGSSWATFANILDKTNTSIYISGLVPGATNWWQVIVYDPLSGYSNTLKTTQPSTASLSYTRQTVTSVQFNWTNNAAYGGFVSFASYQLMESMNDGPFVAVAKVIDESSLGHMVSGLVPSTSYSFYLNTTDQCNGCSAVSSATTESNTVRINTPDPLGASAAASSHSVDVGQPVYFSCLGEGGSPPYAYSWAFGDGSSGTGPSPGHTYGASGLMNVVCTVTDSLGTLVNTQPIKLPVYYDPSITSFTLTPANLELGQRVTFLVLTSGGNGSLTYSYSNLPIGCSSVNSSSFSCTPTSSGIYDVRVTVTDQGQETADSTLRVTIAPSRVLGLPQAMGLVLIFGVILGFFVVAILTVALALGWNKGSQFRPRQDTQSNRENRS